MLKAIDSISHFLRATAAVGLLGLVGYGSWIGYSVYYDRELAVADLNDKLVAQTALIKDHESKIEEQAKDIQQKTKDLAVKQKEIDRLSTALQLLKVDNRVAEIKVLDQKTDEQGQVVSSTVQFTEVNREGIPIGEPKKFELQGDVVWLDTWVATFRDEFVEKGDPMRGASITLMKRIFGEDQAPSDGFPLDPQGLRPLAYEQGGQMSDLERDIWANFWEYANDSDKAEAAGLRTVHGDGPHMQVRKGKLYKLNLRSSGGWSFDVEDLPATGKSS